MLTLYQFPISHFCEKARWALEYKGIEYRVKNLVPGPHLATTRRLGPRTSVPIVSDGQDIVQGSAEIITWLDRSYPARPLTPTTTQDSSMAYEWERSADNNIGVPLRRFFYYHVLQDRALATALLTQDCPWWAGPLYALVFPALRNRMRSGMRIDASSASVALSQLERTFEHLEARLDRHKFLAGPLFSRADLAVSALLAPMWRDTPGLPAAVVDFIDAHRERSSMIWAQQIYADYRRTA